MERFWVFFLSHTAPGFQLWFYFHLYMWVVHWGLAPEAALEGLGLPPVRARCGSGTAAWVTRVLAASDTQGGWRPGQQEIQCSRRVWQPVLANMLQYSCLEKLFSETEVWQAAVYWVAKSWTGPKPPCVHKHMIPPDPPPHLWQLCPRERGV